MLVEFKILCLSYDVFNVWSRPGKHFCKSAEKTEVRPKWVCTTKGKYTVTDI